MCFQLRDAMRVGNISFSDEFFSTTQTTREVKQVLEDELVRRSPKLFSLSLSLCPTQTRLHARVRSATFVSWWRCGLPRTLTLTLLTQPRARSPQKHPSEKQKKHTRVSAVAATTTWCVSNANPVAFS